MNLKEQCGLKGFYTVECRDAQGNLKWTDEIHNGIVTAGKNHILETEFRSGAQIGTWYFGFIDSVGYSALADADTLASHAGWQENAEYSGSRKAWTPGAASGGVMTNGTAISFTMTDGGTIKGAFLCSAASGTSGTLFSTGLFSGGDRVYQNTDVINFTYTLTAA